MLQSLTILTPTHPTVAALLARARDEPGQLERLSRHALRVAARVADPVALACAQAHYGTALVRREGDGVRLLKSARLKLEAQCGLDDMKAASSMLLALALVGKGDYAAFMYFDAAEKGFEHSRKMAASRGDVFYHAAMRVAQRRVVSLRDRVAGRL